MNKQLILRCYAKKEQSHWVAVCIDLSLAAQSDSPKEAIEKLEAMIKSYIDDALTIHKDYADQLLTRKAPLSQLITYYHALCVSYLSKLCHKSNGDNNQDRVFFENYPIQHV